MMKFDKLREKYPEIADRLEAFTTQLAKDKGEDWVSLIALAMRSLRPTMNAKTPEAMNEAAESFSTTMALALEALFPTTPEQAVIQFKEGKGHPRGAELRHDMTKFLQLIGASISDWQEPSTEEIEAFAAKTKGQMQ